MPQAPKPPYPEGFNPQHNPWTRKSRRTAYDNPWIEVWHDEVRTPTGTPGIYGTVHYKKPAIGIVVLDDEQHTWLVGQYRYTLGRYCWEIPEGGGDAGEPPLVSAKRELLEETGLTAERWSQLQTLHLSNSVSDEVGYLYLAQGLQQGQAQPDDTEELLLWRLPFEEAYQLVLNQTITDSLAVAGILRVKLLLAAGQLP